MKAWRLVKAKWADTAYSGEGARLYGSRWNSPGYPVVYTSGSISLAVLEVLVNDRLTPLPSLQSTYRLVPAEFDQDLVEIIPEADLPDGWNAMPAGPASRQAGDTWFLEAWSAVLQVPSVVIPEESNYLVNPNHPDFARIEIGEPCPLRLDARLKMV